jgi:ribonuclease BN (tRNA processing enzyme)
VQWDQLRATIQFVHVEPGLWHEIDGFRVKAKLQPHHGDSYGYRFETGGKAVVYSTDGEHKLQSETETEAMIDFYGGADLVIFDAMYSLSDMITIREDWGHSSNVIGVDLCVRARVKHYCMFHHEPAYSDETIHTVLRETKRYEEIVREKEPLQVSTAYDGLVLQV